MQCSCGWWCFVLYENHVEVVVGFSSMALKSNVWSSRAGISNYTDEKNEVIMMEEEMFMKLTIIAR